MILASPYRPVSRMPEEHRQRLYMIKGLEMMKIMYMTTLTAGVIIEAGQDDGPAGTAGCRRAKGMCKPCTVLRQQVKTRGFNHRIPVAAGIPGSQIIHSNHHNVWRFPKLEPACQHGSGRNCLKK